MIATHWHDDHIRGLGKVFQDCQSAQFCCSAALRTQEFLTLVESYSSAMMDTTGITEMQEVIKVLKERAGQGKKQSPIFATADKLIWQSPTNGSTDCNIVSLSPSDLSMLLAHQEIGSLLPHQSSTTRRVVVRNPNHVAVVLWINIGSFSILLGSDLEEIQNPEAGWSAIVDSSTRPRKKACIFKIAHHGSQTGHHARVWTDLLHNSPIAMLTPFNRGRVRLPQREDKERILSHANNSFITAKFKSKKPDRRTNAVEKEMRKIAKKREQISYSTGQVRLRARPEVNSYCWSVELMGDACELRDLNV